MNEQAAAWAGEFGDAYTDRNRVDWRRRLNFWANILDATGARSVLEIGCGAGWNLTALAKAGRSWGQVRGVDLNANACARASAAGCEVTRGDVHDTCRWGPGDHELVFTAGVLIHVAPADLDATMRAIVGLSNRWVLAIEYEATEEQEIEYRGQQGLLWKRPYGEIYARMGLRPVERGVLTKDAGFDNCTYWLMEKP